MQPMQPPMQQQMQPIEPLAQIGQPAYQTDQQQWGQDPNAGQYPVNNQMNAGYAVNQSYY